MMNKSRHSFIEAISVGNIVAFKLQKDKQDIKMLSGRVIAVPYEGKGHYTIRTKNGSVFFVESRNIVWVKAGTKWPIGIYNALKYDKEEKQDERKGHPREIDGAVGEHQ